MDDLEYIIVALEKSIEKNGPNLPLTNSWLLNILKIAARRGERLYSKDQIEYLQYLEADQEWNWK